MKVISKLFLLLTFQSAYANDNLFFTNFPGAELYTTGNYCTEIKNTKLKIQDQYKFKFDGLIKCGNQAYYYGEPEDGVRVVFRSEDIKFLNF